MSISGQIIGGVKEGASIIFKVVIIVLIGIVVLWAIYNVYNLITTIIERKKHREARKKFDEDLEKRVEKL